MFVAKPKTSMCAVKPVVEWTVLLYEYTKYRRYQCHDDLSFCVYERMYSPNVRWYLSTDPLLCGWYGVVVMRFILSKLDICLNTSAKRAGPLSETMIFGKLNTRQTSSTIALAAVRALQSKTGIIMTYFVRKIYVRGPRRSLDLFRQRNRHISFQKEHLPPLLFATVYECVCALWIFHTMNNHQRFFWYRGSWMANDNISWL